MSKLGLVFACFFLVCGGIPLYNYLARYLRRTGGEESIRGENSAIILFFGVLPLLGVSVLLYLLGAHFDKRR